MDGEEVKAVECDEQEQCQQWRRHGLHILIEEHLFKKMLYVKKRRNGLLVGAASTTAKNARFELRHIVADSYL